MTVQTSCPVCGQRIRLSPDGTVRPHKIPRPSGRHGSKMERCSGSGKTPVERDYS